ncbi:MAG: O-antigen ligase family protein [Bacteroidetes bacterium]|nr:O-antigen ligase family protein [Bacteroidota bacterium]
MVQVSYIMVFYFGAYMLMGKSNAMYYWNIMKLYGLALAAVVVYSFISQMGLGFNRSGASYASYPFFNDHTIYAATIVFVLPSFVCMCLFSPIFNLSYKERALFILLMILLIVSLFFSFCRAADISVIFLMLLLGFIKMKMRFNFFLLFAGVFTCGVVIFSGHIVEYFKKNKVDSNVKNAGFYEQVASVTNITTDASNAERINRWACSIRMFKDKPFVGFGPGTFQFKYIDYQVSNEQTYMSVKKPYDPNLIAHYYWSNGLKINSNRKGFRGRGGSAHSEYFLVLAEEGYFLYYFFYCSH